MPRFPLRALAALIPLVALVASLLSASTAAALPDEQPAPSWSTNGTVWDLVKVGNTIYMGGEFTRLVATNGTTVNRQNLAAINATTGEPLPWSPSANGPVLAVTANDAGTRIFVGGDFSAVGGKNRLRMASIRATDGWVDDAFVVQTGGRVRDLEVTGNQLYLAGEINTVNGQSRSLVARVNASTGALDNSFRPTGSGGAIRGIGLSPDGNRLYVAGAFTQINNSANTRYIAAIRTSDGSTSAWRATLDMPLFDVLATGDSVYLAVGGTGIPNNRLQKHSATTGDELLRYIGDGDIQALELHRNTLYVGGHSGSDFGGLPRFMVAAVDIRDDHILDWNPEIVTDYGVWAIAADDDGVWLGGQFTSVAGQARQGYAALREVGGAETREIMDRWDTWRYWDRGTKPAPGLNWTLPSYNAGAWSVGFGELGQGDGDEDTVVATPLTVYARRSFNVPNPSDYSSVTLRVLADAGAAVYINGTEVARTNLPPWNLSYGDYALSGKYTLAERSWDEFVLPASTLRSGGNTLAIEVHRPWDTYEDLSLAVEMIGTLGNGGPGTFSCTATDNGNGSATIGWTNQSALGYDVSRDGGQPTWVTATSWTDNNPGSNYSITAWGGAAVGQTTTCSLGGPPAAFTCSAVANGNGTATVTWTNQNATGYDVRPGAATAVWATGTTWTGTAAPGTTFTITAWGLANNNGRTTTCTLPGGPAGFTCTASANGNGTATITWTNQNATGYDVVAGAAGAVWATGTTWTGTAAPGTTFTITAWGLANNNGRTATCTLPGGPAGFTCTASANGNGTATITWTNLNATGYDLSRNGGQPTWVTGTSWTDNNPGTSYTITAWGLANNNGQTTTCTL